MGGSFVVRYDPDWKRPPLYSRSKWVWCFPTKVRTSFSRWLSGLALLNIGWRSTFFPTPTCPSGRLRFISTWFSGQSANQFAGSLRRKGAKGHFSTLQTLLFFTVVPRLFATLYRFRRHHRPSLLHLVALVDLRNWRIEVSAEKKVKKNSTFN